MTSGTPPTSVATMGRPAIRASTAAKGNPSEMLERTAMSPSFSAWPTSAVGPAEHARRAELQLLGQGIAAAGVAGVALGAVDLQPDTGDAGSDDGKGPEQRVDVLQPLQPGHGHQGQGVGPATGRAGQGNRSGSTPLGIGWILDSSTPSRVSQVALNLATGATRSARE